MTTPRRAGLKHSETLWTSPNIRESVRRSLSRQPQRDLERARTALSRQLRAQGGAIGGSGPGAAADPCRARVALSRFQRQGLCAKAGFSNTARAHMRMSISQDDFRHYGPARAAIPDGHCPVQRCQAHCIRDPASVPPQCLVRRRSRSRIDHVLRRPSKARGGCQGL